MASGRFVSYLRVSTRKQGESGLGIEAQRAAVAAYLNGGAWTLLAELVEVESGKRDDRPQLARALAHCRLTGATLVIAKLDRLSRNASFLLSMRDAGVAFVAADMPDANDMTVGIMAVVAQGERRAISDRTKAALAAAKARGAVLGGYKGGPVPDHRAGTEALQAASAAFKRRVGPMVRELRDGGASLRQIAAELEARQIRTPRGGTWTAKAVTAILAAT